MPGLPPRRARTSARRIAGLVAACAVLAAPAGAAPGDDGGPYRVRMLYRVGGSLAPFDIEIVASSTDDLGMWFAVELVRVRNRWVERTGTGFGGYAEIAPSAYPNVYGRPEFTAVPPCPAATACASPVPFDGSRRFRVTPTATSRYYFVSTRADVRINASGAGWRLKDVPNPGVRRVLGHRADATGARTLATAAEHFRSATAPGGRYGSSAFAYVPCERTGTGTARLTGRGVTTGDGIPPHRLECGLTSAYPYEYAYTPLQTQWRLAGDVIGAGSAIARLFVFDYPKP